MENSRRYITLLCIFFTILIPISNSVQFVSTNQNITDTTQTVDSSSPEKFRIGFFSPGNSSNRYVGIWFNNVPGPTTVWVANRDNPLRDSTGVLKIGEDGNLIIVAGQKNVIWSSNVTSTVTTNSRAELLDTGNLVLRNGSGRIVWQSFDHPSNVFLPNMTIGINTKTGEKLVITSWKDGENDPSNGNFTLELDPTGIPQSIIMDGFENQPRHWRSGPWNNRTFIGIPTVSSTYLDRFSVLTDSEKGTVYLKLAYSEVKNILQKYTLTSKGNFIETHWNERKQKWEEKWRAQDTECDTYGKCGPFGSCNILDSQICRCLEGFVPKSIDEWRNGNWLGGCARLTELQCQRSNNGTSDPSRTDAGGNEADGFLKYEKMKVPDYVERWETVSAKECRQSCLQNCSCLAYASDRNIGCMWWARDLVDLQKFGNFSGAGIELYVKVASSEFGTENARIFWIRMFIILSSVIGLIIISLCTFFCWRRKTRQGASNDNGARLSIFDTSGETSDQNMFGDNPQLAMFTFETLSVATKNFSEETKLGQGGFGSVYKAKLVTGQEVAVKRLSKSSGQGLEEFKNEVVVISKLQHRNLVRLLGCCIEGEEKILVYEYMPNKSLDAFLFDPAQRVLLNWRKCFEIIEGISRGILYLHRDSRLRVIHRDLKASNVLLDENLNPKISDFGMARIFGGNQLQADTNRVVGTYGYMAPEYAMEGRFSEKSDVFSFGVLLIEIVSGLKSTSFHHQELSLSLLGYAWKLWNESMMQNLSDPTLLFERVYEAEMVRCIHVGLLCVQEFANDRPTMSTILSMLTSEIANLPTPKQPASVARESYISSSSFYDEADKPFSEDRVTIKSMDSW